MSEPNQSLPPNLSALVQADALEAGKTTAGDEAAKREGAAIRNADYGPEDEKDSYGVRKSLKEQVAKNAQCLFFTLYAIILLIILALFAMWVLFIIYLNKTPEKLGTVLGLVVTHAMALAVGGLWKAYHGKNKHH